MGLRGLEAITSLLTAHQSKQESGQDRFKVHSSPDFPMQCRTYVGDSLHIYGVMKANGVIGSAGRY